MTKFYSRIDRKSFRPQQLNISLSLEELNWSIQSSAGRFSLILGHCNPISLQERLGTGLQEICYPIQIRKINLDKSINNLDKGIKEKLDQEQPQALMVYGLESVDKNNIDSVLRSANARREEFSQNFPFPLVFWVTDDVLRKVIRLAPDFYNWAKTVKFPTNSDYDKYDKLLRQLNEQANTILSKFLEFDAQKFIQDLNASLDNRSNIEEAVRYLGKNHKTELDSTLETKVKFILGRDDYANHKFDSALEKFKASFDFWKYEGKDKNIPDYLTWQMILLLHIGLCYCATHESHEKSNFQLVIDEYFNIFSQAEHLESEHLEIVNNFINQISEVLRHLKNWECLQILAKKLESSAHNPIQTAQAYGFLSEVALAQSNWQKADEFAKQAIQTIDQLPEQQQLLYCNRYLLVLGRSQASLGGQEQAIKTLEYAKIKSNPQYNPELYVEILEKLRSLYYEQGKYIRAFNLKQEKLSIQQQYRLRAFIGSGQLLPERKKVKNILSSPKLTEISPLEITASTRQQDVDELVSRLHRNDRTLTIILGKEPGVGKTSILQAGLIPSLKSKVINNRKILAVLQQEYKNWINILGENLTRTITETQNNLLLPTELTSAEAILEQLETNVKENFLNVLIFDELEKLFFNAKSEHKHFFDFLDHCLEKEPTKVILSLGHDYIHYLLDWNRISVSDVVNQNVLNKDFLYYLDPYSPENARDIITELTKQTQLFLDSPLIDQLIYDITNASDKVSVLELQMVGMQLENEKITNLEQYRKAGSKEGLMKLYLEEVIRDCGAENEKIARLVLYSLIDKDGKPSYKSYANLEENLEDLGVKTENLESVLYLFTKSWIVIQTLKTEEGKGYKLTYDYLASIILLLQQPEFSLTAELKQTKAELRESLHETQIVLAQAKLLQHDQLGALLTAAKVIKNIIKMGLQSHIKPENFERLRQVIYSITECNRFQGHGDVVFDVSFSRDGKMLASASIDHTIKLWQLDGTEIRTLRGHTDWVWSIAFSKDNTMLASASDDKTIRLWRISDGELIHTFNGHKAGVRSVRFSPQDEMLVSASEDGTIKLWGIKDKNLIHTFEDGENKASVRSARFSHDGKMIASASDDKTIRLWQVDKYELIRTFSGHEDWVWNVSFSPDDNILASASVDQTIKLWNTNNGKLIRTLQGHSASIRSIRFSPGGSKLTLASGSDDGEVKLWDIDGTEIQTFKGHGGGIRGICFHPNQNLLASGSADQTIRIWKPDESALKTIKGHHDWIWGVSFSPDGEKLASVSADKTVKLWDINGNEIKEFRHNDLVRGIAFSPDGKMLASGSADDTVKIWKLDSKETEEIPPFRHDAKIWSVRFSPDSQMIASSSDDKTVIIWGLDGRKIYTFRRHNTRVTSVRFSPDGKILASADADGNIKLWKLDGTERESFKPHTAVIRSMDFSPDGKMLASASADETVKICHLNGTEIQDFQGHSAGVWSVRFSPDGKMLASGSSDTTVRLWKLDGTEIKVFRGHTAVVLSIAFSPNGELLASASADRTIKLWQLDNLEPQASELEGMLKYGCDWLHDYLKTNPNVSESDRIFCDDISSMI